MEPQKYYVHLDCHCSGLCDSCIESKSKDNGSVF